MEIKYLAAGQPLSTQIILREPTRVLFSFKGSLDGGLFRAGRRNVTRCRTNGTGDPMIDPRAKTRRRICHVLVLVTRKKTIVNIIQISKDFPSN